MVLARYISPEEIRCVTPTIPIGLTEVSVSNNGIDYGSSSLVYEGEIDMMISDVWPTQCSTTGNCTVTLSGIGFANSSSLECRFGGILAVETVFESERSVTCKVPAQAEGAVKIELTTNGVDFTSAALDPYKTNLCWSCSNSATHFWYPFMLEHLLGPVILSLNSI